MLAVRRLSTHLRQCLAASPLNQQPNSVMTHGGVGARWPSSTPTAAKRAATVENSTAAEEDDAIEATSSVVDGIEVEESLPMANEPIQMLPYGDYETSVQAFDYGVPPIEREWWKEGKRMTFWSNWPMAKDVRRRKGVAELGPLRLRLKAMKENGILPPVFRDQVAQDLHNLPRDGCWTLVRNRCQFTSRQRGGVKQFRVSRNVFRMLADKGKLSGIQRAFW